MILISGQLVISFLYLPFDQGKIFTNSFSTSLFPRRVVHYLRLGLSCDTCCSWICDYKMTSLVSVCLLQSFFVQLTFTSTTIRSLVLNLLLLAISSLPEVEHTVDLTNAAEETNANLGWADLRPGSKSESDSEMSQLESRDFLSGSHQYSAVTLNSKLTADKIKQNLFEMACWLKLQVRVCLFFHADGGG